MSTEAKVYEARQAIKDGAEEIDIVINIGAIKDHDYETVKKDIIALRQATQEKILKVIIETCLLTKEEIVKNRCLVKASGGVRTIEDFTNFIKVGADRIGTSAGVSLVKEYK